MSQILKGKVIQLGVQYAFRITPKPSLTNGEKTALESALKTLSPKFGDLFQRIDSDVPKAAGGGALLFQAFRQYPVESQFASGLSFVLATDSISVLLITFIGGKNTQFVESSDRLLVPQWNEKMQGLMYKVLDVIGAKGNRAGKIYELVLGPFLPEEKSIVLESLFGRIDKEIGSIQLQTARFKDIGGKLFNIQSVIQFEQNSLNEPFRLVCKVDVNNRVMEEVLDPQDAKRVWDTADNVIREHLSEILPVEI